jgi:hypothetical protein
MAVLTNHCFLNLIETKSPYHDCKIGNGLVVKSRAKASEGLQALLFYKIARRLSQSSIRSAIPVYMLKEVQLSAVSFWPWQAKKDAAAIWAIVLGSVLANHCF